jgi:hypothetical protein
MKWGDFLIFSEVNLEKGLKGGSVDTLKKIGPKVAGPAHFEV